MIPRKCPRKTHFNTVQCVCVGERECASSPPFAASLLLLLLINGILKMPIEKLWFFLSTTNVSTSNPKVMPTTPFTVDLVEVKQILFSRIHLKYVWRLQNYSLLFFNLSKMVVTNYDIMPYGSIHIWRQMFFGHFWPIYLPSSDTNTT